MNDTILNDLKDAMRQKNKVALTTLRALKAAVKNAAITKGGADAELNDEEILGVIRKQIKQRRDSIQQYNDNGRPELADAEQAEVDVLEGYLPQALSSEEITALVAEAMSETGATGKADMGKVMGAVQKKAAGRADGKALSQAVMQALSAL